MMKTVIKPEEQEKFGRSELDSLSEKSTSFPINSHYTCCECYAAWFGQPICIACGKEKFVITTDLYSEQRKFDIC
ncbi:hypothetical protein [Aliivibrio logei]|nr:hypothetical protein [Aliivibrio logei]